MVDLARVLEPPPLWQQTVAVAEGDLAELRGDLMVSVVVVLPEGERHVGLDLGHRLGDGPLAGFRHVVLDPGKIEKPHLGAVFLADLNRAVDDFPLPPLGRLPIGVVADQRQDDDPMVLAYRLEQNTGDPEHAVVVVGTDAQDGLCHIRCSASCFPSS